jgi:ABC-type nitrate/sulfonate/bicarbonate transport system permease component
MTSQRSKRLRLYASLWHVAATLAILLLPFIFLWLFSRFAKLAAPELFFNLFASTGRLLVAYIISIVIAWTCALLFYQGRRATIALPVFDVLQSFPTFAALPLATYAWGASNFTVIFFLVITIIWPIFFSILSSLKLVRHDWQEAAQIAGLSGWEYLRYFLLPVTTPGLITGSIIGLGEGWEALVATEIIVSVTSGLGSFFRSAAHDPMITAFGILGFLLFIFSINKLIWLPLLDWGHRTMEE